MYQFGFLPRWVGWGVREVQQGGDICIPMADSCWCMAETITILQSNYPPIKNKIKKNKILQLFSFMVGLWMIYIYFFVLLSKSVYIMPYSLPNVYVCVWILKQPSFSWKTWWSHQYGKKLVAYKCFFVFVFFFPSIKFWYKKKNMRHVSQGVVVSMPSLVKRCCGDGLRLKETQGIGNTLIAWSKWS